MPPVMPAVSAVPGRGRIARTPELKVMEPPSRSRGAAYLAERKAPQNRRSKTALASYGVVSANGLISRDSPAV